MAFQVCYDKAREARRGLMLSELNSGSSGLGSSADRGHCAVL